MTQRRCSELGPNQPVGRPRTALPRPLVAPLAIAASLLGGCAMSAEDAAPGESGASMPISATQSTLSGARPQSLKVMTFNIFYGGDDLDLSTGNFCEVGCGVPLREERLCRQR